MIHLRFVLVLASGLAIASGGAQAVKPGENPLWHHERAAEAMEKGDYAVAYCAWRPIAEAGDAEAQYALGWMYHNGYGLAIDDSQARTWWQRAVAQGHLDAMFSLGTLYSIGSDAVPRDFAAAMRLWADAAAAGHVDSQVALRRLVARDIPEVEAVVDKLLTERPDVLGELQVVTVDRANVRNGPGTRHRVGAVVERGTRLVALLKQGEWVKIGLPDSARIGWIHGSLIGERERVAAQDEGKATP